MIFVFKLNFVIKSFLFSNFMGENKGSKIYKFFYFPLKIIFLYKNSYDISNGKKAVINKEKIACL